MQAYKGQLGRVMIDYDAFVLHIISMVTCSCYMYSEVIEICWNYGTEGKKV